LESVSPGRFKHAGANVARYRERWFSRVRPDDVNYYLEDGLLHFSYEGSFPIGISISPRLAVLDEVARASESERLLDESARQIAEIRRENTRLSLKLSSAAPDSEEVRYDRLKRQIQEVVDLETANGSTILVISKGDRGLLQFDGRQAWHFPQSERGVYAGHHPADSAEAISHLETLRSQGAGYLLIPATSLWWLDHYEEFRRHLELRYVRLSTPTDLCMLYLLKPFDERFGSKQRWQRRNTFGLNNPFQRGEIAAQPKRGTP
jgi:hypothetical protein